MDLNHQEAATALGISRPFYTQIENGTRTPSASVLMRMSRFFGQPIEVLMATAAESEKGQ